MDHMNVFMFDQLRGSTIEWEYRPQVCILRNGYHYVPYRNNDSADIVFGNKMYANIMLGLKKCNTSGDVPKSWVLIFQKGSYHTIHIEQSGSVSHEYGGGLMPPSIHVGCLRLYVLRTEQLQKIR